MLKHVRIVDSVFKHDFPFNASYQYGSRKQKRMLTTGNKQPIYKVIFEINLNKWTKWNIWTDKQDEQFLM